MLNIAKEPAGNDTLVIHVAGELTIETVSEMRESLLESFAEPWKILLLEGKELTGVDFFGLQLICSAHRTAASNKKVLAWQEQRPTSLDEVMQIAGFTRHCGCNLCPADQDCMWM